MVLLLGLWFVPKEHFIEGVIKSRLPEELQGAVDFKIEKIDLHKIKVSNLKVDKGLVLELGEIELGYDLASVARGEINDIVVNSVKIELNLTEAGLTSKNTESDNPISIESVDKFIKYLPEQVEFSDIVASIKMKDYTIDSKFKIEIKADRHAGKINGVIDVQDLAIGAKDVALPKFSGFNSFAITKDETEFLGNVSSIGSKYNSDYAYRASSSDLARGILEISNFQFPFGGGEVSLKPIKADLSKQNAITTKVNFKSIDLAEVLKDIDELKGEGKVSGHIILKFFKDGNFQIVDGLVENIGNGVLKISPNLIPGEQEQVKMTREILQNFNYEDLDVFIEVGKDEKSSIKLKIEGSNPEYENGRRVKLNVNLFGDTISLIKNSLLPFNDFKAWVNKESANDK
jgi:hypothetical protein